MIKNFFIFFFSFSLSICAYSSESDAMKNIINQWRIKQSISAVSVAIQMPNKPMWLFLSGTTTMNGRHQLKPTDVFGVGSITKTFIAATILQLQESHKLNLSQSLGEFVHVYPRWSRITLRQLLNMTSGIANFTKTNKFEKMIKEQPQAYYPLSYWTNLAYQQKDLFEPGKDWYYSNTNYYLLAMIIEKVTHHKLADELKQRFFRPLHLKNTYYFDHAYPEEVIAKKVHPYLDGKDVNLENPSYYGPAGSMLMNATDLIHWTEFLFFPGKVLSEDSLKQVMTTIKIPDNPPKPKGSSFGLGIYSLTIPNIGKIWWYTGIINGYSSIMMWLPTKNIFIVAQINGFHKKDFGLLMPGHEFMNTVLSLMLNN